MREGGGTTPYTKQWVHVRVEDPLLEAVLSALCQYRIAGEVVLSADTLAQLPTQWLPRSTSGEGTLPSVCGVPVILSDLVPEGDVCVSFFGSVPWRSADQP